MHARHHHRRLDPRGHPPPRPLNDTDVHYVSAGSDGTPVLLVHGFPESWWAFHKLIPLLAAEHRVIAVDLPGFGDSGNAAEDSTSATAAETLRRLIDELDLGAVHLTGQDISGVTTFRLAAVHPELVRSFAAIETALPGFGMEMLADVDPRRLLAHRRAGRPRDPRDAARRP